MAEAKAAKRQAKIFARNRKAVKKNFEEGKYYEAEQLLKSLAIRLKTKEKYADAVKLLLEGILELLKAGKNNAAVELAEDIVDIYEKTDSPPDDNRIGLLLKICESFQETPDAASSQIEFMRMAQSWTKKKGYTGDKLSLPYARLLHKRKDYPRASVQYAKSQETTDFSNMVFEWAKLGLRDELGFFVTRAVLQVLVSQGDARVARQFFEHCESRMSDTEVPIVKFTRLALGAIEAGDQNLFKLLVQKYNPILRLDPKFNPWLGAIGQNMLGIQAKQNMLSSLMSALGGAPPKK